MAFVLLVHIHYFVYRYLNGGLNGGKILIDKNISAYCPAPHSTPSHRKYLFALSCSAKLISISIVQMLDSNKHKLARQWKRYPLGYTMIKTGSLKNRHTTPMRQKRTPFCILLSSYEFDNPNNKSVTFIGLSCYKTGLTKHVVDVRDICPIHHNNCLPCAHDIVSQK